MTNTDNRIPLQPNFILGHYKLGDCIGGDGHALYYHACSKTGRTTYIIKEIYPYALSQKKLIFRNVLTRKIQGSIDLSPYYSSLLSKTTPARSTFPFLQTFDQIYEINDVPYQIFQTDSARPLRDLMNQRNEQGQLHDLPTLKAVFLCINNILDTIAHAHREGYLLGDITPTNLLIHSDYRTYQAVICTNYTSAFQLTHKQNHTFSYHPNYAPPEFYIPDQLHRVDYTSDLYSIGVILFEILFGHSYRIDCDKYCLLAEEPIPSPYFNATSSGLMLETTKLLKKVLITRSLTCQDFKNDLDQLFSL